MYEYLIREPSSSMLKPLMTTTLQCFAALGYLGNLCEKVAYFSKSTSLCKNNDCNCTISGFMVPTAHNIVYNNLSEFKAPDINKTSLNMYVALKILSSLIIGQLFMGKSVNL